MEDKTMARQKLKRYRMATGICGPTVLYTNIIKAYSPEEAARKYLEERRAEGAVDEVTDDKVAEIAKEMYELEETRPLETYYDVCNEEMSEGDSVLAITKHNTIVMGTIAKFTRRGVKIDAGDETVSITIDMKDQKMINGEYTPFFSKLIKFTDNMAADVPITVGSSIAYVKISYGACEGFGFGTVTRIAPSYIYINTGNEEIRKSAEKVHLIR